MPHSVPASPPTGPGAAWQLDWLLPHRRCGCEPANTVSLRHVMFQEATRPGGPVPHSPGAGTHCGQSQQPTVLPRQSEKTEELATLRVAPQQKSGAHSTLLSKTPPPTVPPKTSPQTSHINAIVCHCTPNRLQKTKSSLHLGHESSHLPPLLSHGSANSAAAAPMQPETLKAFVSRCTNAAAPQRFGS